MAFDDDKDKRRSPSLEFSEIYSAVQEKERERMKAFPNKAQRKPSANKRKGDLDVWEGKSKHLPPDMDRDFRSFGNNSTQRKKTTVNSSVTIQTKERTKQTSRVSSENRNKGRPQERKTIENSPRIGFESKPQKRKSKVQGSSKKAKPKRELRPEAKRVLLGMLATVCFLTVTLVILFTVFKIKTINVVGQSPYTIEEIISKSGCENGYNLLFVPSDKVKSTLLKEFPYIKSINIKRLPPNTLQIEVVPLEVSMSIQSEGNWLYTSANGKIAGSSSSPSENTVKVTGMPTVNKEPGEYIEITDENAKMAYLEVMSMVIEHGSFSKCKALDLTDIYNITINYENRITIKIGNVSDLSYKVGYALDLIEKGQIGEDEKGILDVSTAKENGRGVFSPENGSANSNTRPS